MYIFSMYYVKCIMLGIINTILKKQNLSHICFFVFRWQVLQNIIFLFIMIALLARVENFLINHRFSLGNSRLMFPSWERGNNNLSLRLANRSSSFVL